MNSTTHRLDVLLNCAPKNLLSGGLKGLEKESLRLNDKGLISQTEHPKALGAALTHPYITTDYSEALIELITPPFADSKQTLDYLSWIHCFVYEKLGNEVLLGSSMPCGIDGDSSIPIARYGCSNIGKMKHVYRHGLWHRYGRTMQAIAGIHFNYSLPSELLQFLHQHEQHTDSIDAFTGKSYFGLIRNFQRIGWLILYLFGASPAICKNFFNSRPELMKPFEVFDDTTLYYPYATSLRMSDIGYKSKNQAMLAIDYNSLEAYVSSLSQAINTPYKDYEKIGVNVDGNYKQLNSNILQIENEFYSIMRPKQVALSGEKPTLALKRRGVRYVEMRSLDLNIFHPLGIDLVTAQFIEILLLYCFVQESPPLTQADYQINNQNQLLVANEGRKPGLMLKRNEQAIPMNDWAYDILHAMQPVAQALDQNNTNKPYSTALAIQIKRIDSPQLTPSAQLLAIMQAKQLSFADVALTFSAQHRAYFQQQSLDDSVRQQFEECALQSLEKQQTLEINKQCSFDDFLHHYFAQTD